LRDQAAPLAGSDPVACVEGLSLGLVQGRPRSSGRVHRVVLRCGFAVCVRWWTRFRTATDQKVRGSSPFGRAWSEGVRALGLPFWVSMGLNSPQCQRSIAASSLSRSHNALSACIAQQCSIGSSSALSGRGPGSRDSPRPVTTLRGPGGLCSVAPGWLLSRPWCGAGM
jgi:hypothetical protein